MDQLVFSSRKIATLLLTSTFVATPALAQTNEKIRLRSNEIQRTVTLHGTQVADDAGRIELFVRLDEPAVAELNAQSIASTGSFASSAAQRAQAARVSEQHARMQPLLTGRGAEILSSQRVGANGFRVKARISDIASLRSLPGVVSVGRVEIHKLDNIDSVPWIGAPAVWSALGRGEGVKIGIIDSGIDYTHANFGGSGNPADYDANNPSVIEPGSFPTAKVVGGRDFAGPTYNANNPATVPIPDDDPLDLGGHGTHVAGSAAGIGVAGSIGAGVAPGAQLYALKVFGDNGGSTSLSSLGMEWAMDPNGDGDMSDHLDVINMSLGSSFGSPDDPSAIAANNAAAVGIIVVTSAGNAGDTPYITGSPGVASSAISTAANLPGRPKARFQITSPGTLAGFYPSLEGQGPVTFQQTGPISGTLAVAQPITGCGLTNGASLAGKIALVRRGPLPPAPSCSFTAKFEAVQAAGALAVVVFNDGADSTRIDPLFMTVGATATIPGLMVSYTIGNVLASTPNVSVTLDYGIDPSNADDIGVFSSRGPGHGGSTFKPDLSAPGVEIVSALVGSGTGTLTLDGTSMASPHVAGAAALLRQKHPTLNQAAIKALLQNSTVDENKFTDRDLMRQGVGALRVDRAVALTSYASPGGVSFGRLNPLTPITRSEKVTLKDISGKRRNFSVTHVPNQTFPGVTVTCPSNLRLAGKGEAKFLINLKFDPSEAWDEEVFDDGTISQTEVDGWCVLSDGTDTLRVGYVAVVDPASGVVVLPASGLNGAKVRNVGPSLGWAEAFTLAKLGGEQQDDTYGSIAALGFRRAPDPDRYAPFDVMEFGIALERPFEHLSNLLFIIAIDTDDDGTMDTELVGTDLSNLLPTDPGQFVTAQFDDAGGFIDWEANDWDYNDRTLFLPFTLASTDGLVPEKFNYELTVIARDDSEDVQRGTIDLSKEIVPSLNRFAVDPGQSIDVTFTGPSGTALWLLQNNIPLAQPALSINVAK